MKVGIPAVRSRVEKDSFTTKGRGEGMAYERCRSEGGVRTRDKVSKT